MNGLDAMIESTFNAYECKICEHRWVLRSNSGPIGAVNFKKWVDEIKGHECHANTKNTN